jgi:hypothetical protein
MAAYADAKLMNILHIQDLLRRCPGLAAASFHSGMVATDFARDGSWWARLFFSPPISSPFLKSPQAGADTMVWLAETEPGRDW